MEEQKKTARQARVPLLRIEVKATSDLIDTAVRRDSHNCFVADAIKEARPDFTAVTVDLQAVRATDPTKRLRYIWMTPRVCQEALINFDQGIAPEPFEFVLGKAMQIVRGRGPYVKRSSEEKAKREVEKRRKDDAVRRSTRGRSDEPFAPPAQYTREVRQAMDQPTAPLGPVIAMNPEGGSWSSVPVQVGGNAPRYPGRRGGGKPKSYNMGHSRRFGVRELIP